MFALLRMVALIGFNPSGPESADAVASDISSCPTQYQRVVHETPSNLSDFQGVGTLIIQCADGNVPGRWDRPVFSVETTSEESSGDLSCTSCPSHS